MEYTADALYKLFQEENYTLLFFDQMDEVRGVKRTVRDLKDGLGRRPSSTSLRPSNNNPNIFRDISTTLHYFCISDLLRDLFIMDMTSKAKNSNGEIVTVRKPRLPLIDFKDGCNLFSNDKEKLAFILPKEFFDEINDEGRLIESDFGEFLNESSCNVKITKLIHSIFESDRKGFVQKIQNHFAEKLKSAIYTNKNLRPYLKALGDYIIVPKDVSPTAHSRFTALLNSEDDDDILTVIANILISAILGLYSVNYVKIGCYEKQKRFCRRTYLLDDLGMRYIWMPELFNSAYEKLQTIQQLYEHGKYKMVCEQIELWLSSEGNTARKSELSLAYQLIGFCMYNYPNAYCDGQGTEVETQNKGVSYLLECVNTGEASSEVYYQLYKCFLTPDCTYSSTEKAIEFLKAAFDANNAKAVAEVTSLILGSSNSDNYVSELGITPSEALKKLYFIIETPEQYSSFDISECLYLRGLIRKALNEADAEQDFIAAAQNGHEKAKQQISRKARASQTTMPTFSHESSSKRCFVNSLDGNNLLVLSTFPNDEWTVFSTEEETHSQMGVQHINSLDAFIDIICSDKQPESSQQAVILFMSEDDNQNLNECLLLLDKLFNIVLDKSESKRKALINLLDIYIEADYDSASMLIDANLSDMGNDIFFKVHIKDAKKEATHQLLCDAPLFIPFLDKSQNEKAANIVLLGSTDANYCFIKESIACVYMGKDFPVTITMLGNQADYYEARLRQECPGIFPKNHVSCIVPGFIQCDFSKLDFPSYIYGSDFENLSDNPIVNTLNIGNYFVVDLNDDFKGIQFGMKLRTWLLRSRGSFNRTPFIAVKCSDERSAYLADHLTVSGRSPGSTYYSRYNLFAFGMSKQIYSYQRMIESCRLEEIALNVHKSYCGDNEFQAENDFYSYSYNSDSSICTAIGLSYRLFVAGLYFKDVHEYRNGGALCNSILYTMFSEKLEQILESAAALEQSRWNGFALSRGWVPATESQVEAYREQSTGSSHCHLLAKLHPFILDWDEIQDEKIRKVLGVLKSKFNYGKSPQAITRQSVRDTAKFVEKASSKNKVSER